MNKLVSVIITTYARPDNLIRAINSVLSQTYTNIEIIVVDDNGLNTPFQKETEEILRDYIISKTIIYIPHDVNRNGSAARNTGFYSSHGEFVNFMDDDDTFETLKIEKQIQVLDSHPEYGACYCNIHMKGISKGDYDIINNVEGNLAKELLCGKVRFNTTTVLFRREIINSLNGFDETFLRHQDWELFLRFFRKNLIGLVYGSPLICKYQTPNAVTRDPHKALDYKEKFLKTFKDDIDKLINSNEIYKFQYLQLGQGLIGTKYRSEGLRYVKKANNYKSLDFHDWFKIISSYLYSFVK